MVTGEVSTLIRYVVDVNGEKTDVMIPVAAWRKMLASWKKMVELAEDKEGSAIRENWRQRRAAGNVETISLDDLERELMADGLLPG